MKRVLLVSCICWVVMGRGQSVVCHLLGNIPATVKVIKDSADKLFHNINASDRCFAELRDSLEKRFIASHKTEYLECLDYMCFYCSEDAREVVVDTNLFYKSFKPFVDYMFKHGDTANCLELTLEVSFGITEMEDPNDRIDAKKRLESFIKQQEGLYNFSDKEKKFIELIKQQAETLKAPGE